MVFLFLVASIVCRKLNIKPENINLGVAISCSHTKPTYAPVNIIGFDGTLEGIESIENGLLLGSVLNDSLSQSRLIVELTSELLSGKTKITKVLGNDVKNDRFLYSKSTMITRDSLDN